MSLSSGKVNKYMIESIKGSLKYKNPSKIIIEAGGLGYSCSISSNTYDTLPELDSEVCLLTYFHVTENQHSLFAFSENQEKELFTLLIGVSGIGPKTAIVLLSSVSPDEFKKRLIASEVSMLTALPGIGPKTARRIIVELKDKFVKLSPNDLPRESVNSSPEIVDAFDALLALGFQSEDIRKTIANIQENQESTLPTESIIKKALVQLK